MLDTYINTYDNLSTSINEFAKNSITENRIDYINNLVNPIIYNDLNNSIFVFVTKRNIIASSIINDLISRQEVYEYSDEDNFFDIYDSRSLIIINEYVPKYKETYQGYIDNIIVDNIKLVPTIIKKGIYCYCTYNVNYNNWNDDDIHVIQIKLYLVTEDLEEDEKPYTYIDSAKSNVSESILRFLPLNSIIVLPKTLTYLPNNTFSSSIKGMMNFNGYIETIDDLFKSWGFSNYKTVSKQKFIEVCVDEWGKDESTAERWYNAIQYIKPLLLNEAKIPQVYMTSDFLPEFGFYTNFQYTSLHLLNEMLYNAAYQDANYKPLVHDNINLTKDFYLANYPYIMQTIYNTAGAVLYNHDTAASGGSDRKYIQNNFEGIILTDSVTKPTTNNKNIENYILLEQNNNLYTFFVDNSCDVTYIWDGNTTREVYHLLKSKTIPQYLFYSWESSGVDFIGNQEREYLLSAKIDDTFTIYGSVFTNPKIKSVTLMSKIPPTLHTEMISGKPKYSAFNLSGNNYPIYVPDDAVTTYKESPYYVNYISRIKPLSEKITQ